MYVSVATEGYVFPFYWVVVRGYPHYGVRRFPSYIFLFKRCIAGPSAFYAHFSRGVAQIGSVISIKTNNRGGSAMGDSEYNLL